MKNRLGTRLRAWWARVWLPTVLVQICVDEGENNSLPLCLGPCDMCLRCHVLCYHAHISGALDHLLGVGGSSEPPTPSLRAWFSLVPRPTPQGGRVWEITLLSSWNATISEFIKLPLSDLQHDWSFTTPIFKISMFYRIYICFLSLVKLERWLAGLTFFPSSTQPAAFRPSRHFRA